MQHQPSTTTSLRGRYCDRTDDGFSSIGILSVILILGVLVAIPLSLNVGSSSSTTTLSRGATTTTAPKTIASGAIEAAIAACRADFETITQALGAYRALNGSNPPGGTSWATSATNGGPFLQSWPVSSATTRFVWNGAILSVIPTHGITARGSYGTPAAKNGCFAVAPS